jgi:hypothetical protein
MTLDEVQEAISTGQRVWMRRWDDNSRPLMLVQLSTLQSSSMIFDAMAHYETDFGEWRGAVKKEWLSPYPHVVTETI